MEIVWCHCNLLCPAVSCEYDLQVLGYRKIVTKENQLNRFITQCLGWCYFKKLHLLALNEGDGGGCHRWQPSCLSILTSQADLMRTKSGICLLWICWNMLEKILRIRWLETTSKNTYEIEAKTTRRSLKLHLNYTEPKTFKGDEITWRTDVDEDQYTYSKIVTF